jgi:hypothetical protein
MVHASLGDDCGSIAKAGETVIERVIETPKPKAEALAAR